MDGNEMLERALQIAFEAHREQKDKYGEPYLGHLTRVMNQGRTLEEKTVGMLHDLVEDTRWTLDDLRKEGFPENIVFAISCLTKISEDEPYESFIERVKASSLAVRVKLHDLTDNMDLRRIPVLTEKEIPRINKYLKAYRTLSSWVTLSNTPD